MHDVRPYGSVDAAFAVVMSRATADDEHGSGDVGAVGIEASSSPPTSRATQPELEPEQVGYHQEIPLVRLEVPSDVQVYAVCVGLSHALRPLA